MHSGWMSPPRKVQARKRKMDRIKEDRLYNIRRLYSFAWTLEVGKDKRKLLDLISSMKRQVNEEDYY